MRLSQEQRCKVIELAHPLAQWMADNCHPHVKAIVENDRVEFVECIATSQISTVVPAAMKPVSQRVRDIADDTLDGGILRGRLLALADALEQKERSNEHYNGS